MVGESPCLLIVKAAPKLGVYVTDPVPIDDQWLLSGPLRKSMLYLGTGRPTSGGQRSAQSLVSCHLSLERTSNGYLGTHWPLGYSLCRFGRWPGHTRPRHLAAENEATTERESSA